MKTKINMWKENISYVLVGALFSLFVIWSLPIFSDYGVAQVYNETAILNTTVNITNAAPLVTSVTLQNPINLVGYNNASVICNATVTDYDNDTLVINATLYQATEANPLSADDGNNHYTNTSCIMTSVQDINTTWQCGFMLNFYANNASDWYCNVTAVDPNAFPGTNISSASTVNPLIAIVIPGVLDFGELITGEISDDKIANITNGGNRNLNLSVKAYGETEGDGIAMKCTYNDITFPYMKYNYTNSTDFGSMTEVSNDSTNIYNDGSFLIGRRTSEIDDNESTNSTHWKLEIPYGVGGVCNGKLLFTGTDSQFG